jgi:uncharacterized membrane protein
MQRNSGIGFVVFGIILAAVGLIMRFAVHITTTGFSIHSAGIIMVWAGVVVLVIGILLVALGGRTSVTTRDSTVMTPTGQEHIQEQDSSSI